MEGNTFVVAYTKQQKVLYKSSTKLQNIYQSISTYQLLVPVSKHIARNVTYELNTTVNHKL